MTYKTNQEIFDTVMRHLYIQGRQSTNGGRCLYRADDGSKCAVGILIPKEHYRERFEGQAVFYLAQTEKDLFPTIGIDPTMSLCLLADLQGLHDSATIYRLEVDRLSWEKYLERRGRTVAQEYNLKFNLSKYKFEEPKCPTTITSKATSALRRGLDTILAI